MQLNRFALGIKFDFLSGTAQNAFATRMFEELFSILTLPDLVGLEIYGGVMPHLDETADAALGDIYLVVIMGGGLKQTRRIYQKIADDAAINMYLAHRRPFIENNRLLNVEGLEFLGEVQKNGKLTGGSELLSALRVPKTHGSRVGAGKGVKILLAPDAISPTLTSMEAVKRLTLAARRHFQGIKVIPMPIADGGKDTMSSLVIACDGFVRQSKLRTDSGEKRAARYGVLYGKTAVIELAETASLYCDADSHHGTPATTPPPRGIPPEEGNYSSFPTIPTHALGQLIRRALDEGLSDILIGIGDYSATDCGMGLAHALGVKFFDIDDNELTGHTGDENRVFKIDMDYLHPRIGQTKFTVMVSQRDADISPMPQPLHDALMKASSRDFSEASTENQFGALTTMLQALTGAIPVKGTSAMLDAVKFEKLLKGVALVVTGCDRLDGESVAREKPVIEIMRRCALRKIPVAVIAASIDDSTREIYRRGNAGIMTLFNTPMDEDQALNECDRLFDGAADRMFRFIRMGRDVEKIGAPKKPQPSSYFDLQLESLRRELGIRN